MPNRALLWAWLASTCGAMAGALLTGSRLFMRVGIVCRGRAINALERQLNTHHASSSR